MKSSHRMVRPGFAVRLGAVLATLAVVVAACSSGKSSGGGGGATTVPAKLTPKPGGTTIMATEAEIDGFDPTQNRWDATGYMYANTVFDPLAALAPDGTAHPFLAQSITPNADSTVWTITMRPNIKFSDGEPLNADAVLTNLKGQLASFLTSKVLSDVKSVAKVDDMTVAVNMKAPWVPFPQILAGQIGYIAAPKQLADPKTAPRNPIGTGPFIFKEWVPGNHFTAVKNPNYWRPGLPYLDSIQFRPITDFQARENSLKAGTIDIFHTTDVQTILDFRGDKSFNSYEQTVGRVEEDFQMINTSKPPVDDIRIRQALAYALDRQKYNQIANLGVLKLANGPYSDGSGYTNAPGYPNYDLQKAKDLVNQYKASKGVSKVSIELGTTNVGKNLQDESLIADMFRQAGFDVNIVQVEQSDYILNALEGKYTVYGWRQFGEPDPDADTVWWDSNNANPPLALNFARNKNAQIDADLATGRSSTSVATRQSAYTDISAQFNKDIPYLWTNQVLWDVVGKPSLEGVLTPTFPDGSPLRALNSGVFSVAQLWNNS